MLQIVKSVLPSPQSTSDSDPLVPEISKVPQAFIELDSLPIELKRLIAKKAGSRANKALRQVNRSFKDVGTNRLTVLDISDASKMSDIREVLLSLPKIETVKVTDPENFRDYELVQLISADCEAGGKIKSLDLSRCWKVTNIGIGALAYMEALVALNTRGVVGPISDPVTTLADMTQLTSLDLGGCCVDESILRQVGELKQLRHLNLRGGFFANDALACLENLTKLQSLDLTWCHNVDDSGLKCLKTMTSLHALSIAHCLKVRGHGLAHLSGMQQLRSLDLDTCIDVGDFAIAQLQNMKHMQALRLRQCSNITNEGLASLAGMTQMKNLCLSWNSNLSNQGLVYLAGMKQLKLLDLSASLGFSHAAINRLKTSNLEIRPPFPMQPDTTADDELYFLK